MNKFSLNYVPSYCIDLVTSDDNLSCFLEGMGFELLTPPASNAAGQLFPSSGAWLDLFLCSIWNTFTFEIENLRVLYRFVGRNRYRSVTDTVFENRLPDHVFSNGNLPTSCFLQCRYDLHIYAPDSVLSFLLQNRYFVGSVGKNQIM